MHQIASVWIMVATASLAMAAVPGVTVDGQKLTVRTATVEAVFDGPSIVSLRAIDNPVEFIHPKPAAVGVDIFYLNRPDPASSVSILGQVNNLSFGHDKHQTVSVKKLSTSAAWISIKGNDSHRLLLVAIDKTTGDIRVTPSGLSARRGVRSVGWRVPIHPEATLILPVVNGMKLPSDSPDPVDARWAWPSQWEAQLAIAERDGASMMIHCEDQKARFKALRQVCKDKRTELCFESEPTGPLWHSRTAGGIEWRINVYKGNWKTPATRYRDWMAKAYDLADKRKDRPDWVENVTMAITPAGPNEAFLDALAQVHPPDQTLIHLATGWRVDKYDINYPDYTPSDQGLRYVAKARAMGFHVMPHFNYWAVYEKHPFFQQVRDFQIRSVDQNRPLGYYYPWDTHDYTRLAYIHPGLGLWRNKLIETVIDTCAKLQADAVFLDQTLCTTNNDNGLIEGMNTIEGMQQLQQEFATIYPGVVLAGEGLNEMSFQRQCFAQGHIRNGWGGQELTRKHVEEAHGIGSFLWAGHTRLIGYGHQLMPKGKYFDLAIEVYERMGAIPTIATSDPSDIQKISVGVKRILDRAKKKGG